MKKKNNVIFRISLLILTVTVMIFLSVTVYGDSNNYNIKAPRISGPYTFNYSIDHGTLSSYSTTDQLGGSPGPMIIAYPADGYEFDGWYSGSVKLESSGMDANGNTYTVNGRTLTITNSQASATYQAKTVKKMTATLTFVMDNGTVSTSSQTVNIGDAAATVIGTPNSGFEFAGIYNGSTQLALDGAGTDPLGNAYMVLGNTIIITNTKEDATYTFKTVPIVKKTFTVAYIAKSGDTIYQSTDEVETTIALTWDMAGKYNEMQAFFVGGDLEWEIPEGKAFSCWTNVANGKKYKPGDTINLTADTVLQAVFEDIKDKDSNADDNNGKLESSNNNKKDSTSKEAEKEKSTKAPTTGDQNDIIAWLILALVGIGGVGTTTVAYRKK